MTVLVLFTDAPWSNHESATSTTEESWSLSFFGRPSQSFPGWLFQRVSTFALILLFAIALETQRCQVGYVHCVYRVWVKWDPDNQNCVKLKCKLPYLLRVPINDNPCLTCVDLAVLLIELSDKPNRNGSNTFKIIQTSCPWFFEWLLLKSLHNHKL